MKPKIKKIKRYNPEMVNSMPDHLFIFGDNTIGKGMGGQAIIRFCENSYGIPTQKLPSQLPNSFFNDNDYDKNIIIISESIKKIPMGYEYIVFPEDGLGTGLAELPIRAPRTYQFLIDEINNKFGEIYKI